MTVDSSQDLRSLGEAGYADDRWRPIATGAFANRPAVSLFRANAFYFATDTATLYYSNGAAWSAVGATAPTITRSLASASAPSSPVTGDLWIMYDSTTAPTYRWMFEYNSTSSSAYKWEFVGGWPVNVAVATGEATGSNTFTDLATVGPTFTLPRAGDYDVEIHANMQPNTSGIASGISFADGAASSFARWASAQAPTSLNANQILGVHGKFRTLAQAASQAVKMQYKCHDGGAFSTTFSQRIMFVTPVRIS